MEVSPGEIAQTVQKAPTANIAISAVLMAFCLMGYLFVHMMDGIGEKVSEATKGAAALKASMDVLTAELHSGLLCRQLSATDPRSPRNAQDRQGLAPGALRQMTAAEGLKSPYQK